MARWNLAFRVDEASALPLFVQIARAIAEDVRRGRLLPGTRLPGTRVLAASLGINRNTVAAAYDELESEGWVTATTGSGTYVTENLGDLRNDRRIRRSNRASAAPMSFDLPPFARAHHIDAATPPGLLKWDYGVPDVRLAPTRELARAYRRALKSDGHALLHYERYRDERVSRLQRAIAAMLRSTRALDVSAEQLVVTHGSQMALYLLARCLLRPGDTVAVENPGASSLWDIFTEVGATVVPVEVDAEGVRVDRLSALVEKTPIRAVLLTPHHQLPTTVTLSVARRMELLALARKERFAIIEDDYDHEFHYDGRPVLPMAASDDWGSVAYVGTLSKLFGPGLRVGYVVAPAPLAQAIRTRRTLVDIQGDNVLESALAELFEEGEMQRHFNRARRVYAARRELLVSLLQKRLGGVLSFDVPAGGMAIWARVDPSVDVEAWAERARDRGLLFRTGKLFSAKHEPIPFVRLGFAMLDEAELLVVTRLLVASLPKAGHPRDAHAMGVR